MGCCCGYFKSDYGFERYEWRPLIKWMNDEKEMNVKKIYLSACSNSIDKAIQKQLDNGTRIFELDIQKHFGQAVVGFEEEEWVYLNDFLDILMQNAYHPNTPRNLYPIILKLNLQNKQKQVCDNVYSNIIYYCSGALMNNIKLSNLLVMDVRQKLLVISSPTDTILDEVCVR